MSPIVRPTFSEGQVLGAGDLNAHVTYDRLAMGLHERTEHLWGVAAGLTLQERKADDQSYVELTPGRAIDRFGRAIVATEPRRLDPQELASQITRLEDDGELYPVFVQALDIERRGQTQPGKCAVEQVSRIEENLQISFGPPGSEIPILEQEAAAVDDEREASRVGDKVLVGWVTWSATLKRFGKVETSCKGRGIRYVGVVASEVVAAGGALGLRTRPDGARYALTLTENGAGGCELRFGKQDGPEPPTPTFTVDDKGNITYSGTLSPAPASAKTFVESGVIFHGLRLPLPAGVTEEQVASGKLRLHAVLTSVPQVPAAMVLGAPPARVAVPMPLRCKADLAGDRRVQCLVRWYDPTNPIDTIDLPGSCTYLLIAAGS
jgi:hypothetical protein